MRKLAWSALSFSSAVFLAHYVIPSQYVYSVIAVLVLLAVIGALILREKRRTVILLVCIFSILGLLRYDGQVRSKLHPVNDLIGSTYEIRGVVTEFPQNFDTYSRVTVKLRGDDLPNCKVLLYDYDGETELLPGQIIQGSVKFASAEVSAGVETDTYISKGIFLRGYLQSDITVEEGRQKTWLYGPAYLGRWIRDTVDEYVPERTGAFLKALLTGDKTALYDEPQLYNALSKAGVAHVVTVSGMHVSFLISLVLMMTGSRRGWILSIGAMMLFALMTGLSPSVLRAAFMQILFLLAPVFRRESDGITSISAALFILLLINPFSAASVSLQLSFASMAGIILVTPKVLAWLQEKGKNISGRQKGVYIYIAASIATSVGATVCTAPLCAYYFGYISLLAPLTNLLVLWVVPYCFGGGFLICLLAGLWSGAALAAGVVVSWGVEFIYWVANLVADSPLAAAYLPGKQLILWFAATYLLIGLSYLLKGDRPYRPLVPVCLSIMSLFLVMCGVMRYYQTGTTVAAVDVGQGQSIVLLDDTSTLVVDCGGDYDAGQTTADWLYTHGRHNVDLLVLTHFDRDHTNGVVDLMSRIPVAQILCCNANLSDAEAEKLSEIESAAVSRGTKMTHIEESVRLSLVDIQLTAYMLGKSDSNDGIIVLAQIGEFDMLITGDADQERELELLLADDLPDGECIVAGHHGSKSSTGEPILDAFAPEVAFISSGYNHYGHPTQEVLDRLEERNVVIYRTDQLGNIEIKVR